MKKFSLVWYGPLKVTDLSEELKNNVTTTDKKYPFLNSFGFYVYLKDMTLPPAYIGQAFSKNRSLRNRVRWEITRDGVNHTLSTFSQACLEKGINKNELLLIVAHVTEATENGSGLEYNPNDIEMALIHEYQPIINKRGKKRYRRGRLEIHNSGSYGPLSEIIQK